MKTYSCSLSFALFILSVTGSIIYRDYEKGDSSTNIIFKKLCPWKKGIPCYVAVDTDASPKTVIGFIVLSIPMKLTEKEEQAVKAKVPGKKGNLGYIKNVEVDSDFSGRGIGTHLLEYGIDRGRKAANILAMTLHVDEDNIDAIRLYKRLGFIEILKEDDMELFAKYLV